MSNDRFRTCKREIRVTPIAWPHVTTFTCAENLSIADRLLGRLLPGSTDFVCLPEGFLYAGVPYATMPSRLPNDLTVHFQRWSKRLNAYVFVPTLQYKNDSVFNVVHVYDRDGSLLATYRKMHPWPISSSLDTFEYGATPGHDANIIDTEFGSVGIQMCFDVNWSLGWEKLARQEVKLIIFPSDYPGGFALRVRAWQSRATIIAPVLRNGSSRIIDFTGEIIASLSCSDAPTTFTLNLNACLVHLDHNVASIEELKLRQPELVIRRLEDDNVVRIEAPADSEPIEALLKRYGIRTLDKYLSASEEIIRRRRLLSPFSDSDT